MDYSTRFVVKHKKMIICLFVIGAAVCAFLSTLVGVDYKFADYLPDDAQTAMINAVKQSVGSVMSSGLTTVTGFAALILMRFKIGPDMGWFIFFQTFKG